MITPSFQDVRKAVEAKGHKWFDGHGFDMNIVGIRKEDSVDLFDDTLCLCYRNNSGVRIIEHFPFTTKPGLKSILKPLNPLGTAIIAEGQYPGVWSLATPQTGVRMHNGKIPCLRQVGKFLIYRDNNMDSVIDKEASTRSWVRDAGLNLHPFWGSSWVMNKVGLWSAGCQVVGAHKDSAEYKRILELFALQLKKYPNSFTYTLLNEKDLSIS